MRVITGRSRELTQAVLDLRATGLDWRAIGARLGITQTAARLRYLRATRQTPADVIAGLRAELEQVKARAERAEKLVVKHFVARQEAEHHADELAQALAVCEGERDILSAALKKADSILWMAHRYADGGDAELTEYHVSADAVYEALETVSSKDDTR